MIDSRSRQDTLVEIALVGLFGRVSLPGSIGFQFALAIVIDNSDTVMGLALSLALPRLMSRRSAVIVRSAADSSANWRIEPTTILRCLRLPSGPDSRHLNSQTSGPFNRLDRVILPFCIVAPFLLLVLFDQNFLVGLLLWQIRGEPEMQADKITGRLCRSAGMPRILVNSAIA